MRVKRKYHLVKLDGKVGVRSVFCCPYCYGNMEGNITRVSREKLYAELRWELQISRRHSRRLTLFYKMMKNLTPKYTMDAIPQLQQSQYSLSNQDVIGRIRARAEKFKSSFYPNCPSEWNELFQELERHHHLLSSRKSCSRKFTPPPC